MDFSSAGLKNNLFLLFCFSYCYYLFFCMCLFARLGYVILEYLECNGMETHAGEREGGFLYLCFFFLFWLFILY
ncbi:hypothetical protein BZA77DRAFT_304152 [Pyronema omphalodes]|nr:hypothetical protein BZA77DRAFT_304152 [Pyronema omphalodes]